jgi:hypothetical protein
MVLLSHDYSVDGRAIRKEQLDCGNTVVVLCFLYEF